MKKPEFFLKIKPTISFILILLIASVIVITLSLQYYFSKDLAFNATENNFKITAEKIEQKIITFDKSNSDILTTIIHSEEMKEFPKIGENHRLLKQLTVILENKKHIYAIYAGNKEGEFFEVINLNVSEKLRAKYEVSNEVKWLIIKIYEEDGKKVKYEEYLDKDLVILKTLKKKTKYNPSIRPWFKKAFSTKNVIKTKPYKYTNFDELGITYAKKIKNSDIVLGVDVLLNSISTFLDKQTHIEDKQILIFQEDSKIIAAANLANNTKTVPYKQLIAFSKDKKIQTLNFNLKLEKEYFVYYSVIKTEFKNKDYLAILIPIDTIMKPFIDKIYNSF